MFPWPGPRRTSSLPLLRSPAACQPLFERPGVAAPALPHGPRSAPAHSLLGMLQMPAPQPAGSCIHASCCKPSFILQVAGSPNFRVAACAEQSLPDHHVLDCANPLSAESVLA